METPTASLFLKINAPCTMEMFSEIDIGLNLSQVFQSFQI